MSPEVIELLKATIPVIGTITGVIVGLFFTYLISKQQFRTTVISGSRQQWINSLRDSIAEFETQAKIAITEATIASQKATSQVADAESHYLALKSMHLQLNKTALLLNPNEDAHMKLLELIRNLEDVVLNSEPPDRDSHDRLQDKITESSQIILKQEWEKLKHGK